MRFFCCIICSSSSKEEKDRLRVARDEKYRSVWVSLLSVGRRGGVELGRERVEGRGFHGGPGEGKGPRWGEGSQSGRGPTAVECRMSSRVSSVECGLKTP